MAKYTYNKNEERGQFSAHVLNEVGNTVWEVNYPEFYEDESTGELIECSTIFDDGFMKNTDDVEGLESYLKNIGVIQSEDEIVITQMADGGSVEQGNIDMIKNQVVQVEHHANELKQTLKSNPQVDAWVVAKMDRATSNLSDITHYLEGEQNSFADGGYMDNGGVMPYGENKPYYKEGDIFTIENTRNAIIITKIDSSIGGYKDKELITWVHTMPLGSKNVFELEMYELPKFDRYVREGRFVPSNPKMADGGILENKIDELYEKSNFINDNFNWKSKLLEMLQDKSIEAYNIYQSLTKNQKKAVLQELFEMDNDMGSEGDGEIETSIENLDILLEDAKGGRRYVDGGYMAKGGVITKKNREKIIDDLIKNRENELSILRLPINLTKNSLGNPQITVGVIPYQSWSKKKELTFVITYGRYLSLEMLVYESYKKDSSFIEAKGKENAIKVINKILDDIETQINSNKMNYGGYMENGGKTKSPKVFQKINIVISDIDMGGDIVYKGTHWLNKDFIDKKTNKEIGDYIANKYMLDYGNAFAYKVTRTKETKTKMELGGENDYEDEGKSYGHRYEDYDDNFQTKMRAKYMRKMMQPSSYQIEHYRHSDFQNKDADDVKRINRKLARGGKTDDYETYHNTLSAALSEAERFVNGRGYEFSEESYFPDLTSGGVKYGQTISTKRDVVEIGGKNRKNTLILVVYRMDSGKYELTMYFAKSNYANGGTTYRNLSDIPPTYVNEPKAKTKYDGLVTKVKEVELVRKGVVEFKGVNQINTSQDSAKIFRQFWDENALNISEHFNVLLLNRANKPIGIYQHSKGSIDGTTADIIMICLAAVKSLAKGVIVAHNHPSGNLKPSEADKRLTSQLKNALSFFTITLLDSIILTPNDGYYSFTDDGMMEKGGQTSKMVDGGAIEKMIKEKLKSNFELPFEVVVYIPSTEKATQVIGKRDFNERADAAEVFMSNLFGGFSATSVDGGYVGNKGNLIQEDAIKVTSFCQTENFTDNFKDFLRQVKIWAGEWTQEAIGIEFEGDMFYVNSFKQDAISSLFPNDDSNVRKIKWNKLPKSEKDAALSKAKKVFEATSFS